MAKKKSKKSSEEEAVKIIMVDEVPTNIIIQKVSTKKKNKIFNGDIILNVGVFKYKITEEDVINEIREDPDYANFKHYKPSTKTVLFFFKTLLLMFDLLELSDYLTNSSGGLIINDKIHLKDYASIKSLDTIDMVMTNTKKKIEISIMGNIDMKVLMKRMFLYTGLDLSLKYKKNHNKIDKFIQNNLVKNIMKIVSKINKNSKFKIVIKDIILTYDLNLFKKLMKTKKKNYTILKK